MTKKYLIKAIGFGNGAPCPHAGHFLQSFDFEAFEGQGFGVFTTNPANAKKFDTADAAMDFWGTVSVTEPTRLDGKPNRPLTSLTAEIVTYSGG